LKKVDLIIETLSSHQSRTEGLSTYSCYTSRVLIETIKASISLDVGSGKNNSSFEGKRSFGSKIGGVHKADPFESTMIFEDYQGSSPHREVC